MDAEKKLKLSMFALGIVAGYYLNDVVMEIIWGEGGERGHLLTDSVTFLVFLVIGVGLIFKKTKK
ncbi:hypothetical protein HY404_01755 [Candidatus Microgenomates bacterium]|nr:hypothetical protein [Candidatus Microgenomates bacterium]